MFKLQDANPDRPLSIASTMARASRVQEAQAPAVLVDGTAIRLAEIVGNLYSNTMLVLEIRGWGSPVNGKFSTKTKDEIH